MIEAIHLNKRYGDFEAVSDVTFSAKKGEIVGLLGLNGAGKTTTLKMLATVLPPTSGSAIISGFDIRKDPDQVRKRLGFLGESPALYPELTVVEYLTFFAKLRGLADDSAHARVETTLMQCGLNDVRKKLCQHLSRGYRQRVGIAQAMVHDPEVLILDEPTSGLDPKQIVEMRKLVQEIGATKSVILSTHILNEVKEICSRVVIIAKGRVALESRLEALSGAQTLEQQFLDCVNVQP